MTCEVKYIQRLRSGDLKHKVNLQSSSLSQSASGEASKTWSTYASPWCKIEPRQADEDFAGDQLAAMVTHTVKLRYTSDYTPTHKHRVLYGTRKLYIKRVINIDEANHTWVLECTEDTA